jgi:hypothetical protein
VLSGKDILEALEDDYVEIGAGQTPSNIMKLLIAGDIVSFSNLEHGIIHTAVVIYVPRSLARPAENALNNIKVNSKNGINLECVQYLSSVRCIYSYAPLMRFWRAR